MSDNKIIAVDETETIFNIHKLPFHEKCAEVLKMAAALLVVRPNWIEFFRLTLGVGGTIQKAFPDYEEHAAFLQTHQYKQIQRMLAMLRGKAKSMEQDRVITVRLPTSLHESLKHESDQNGMSLNYLCIQKLLEPLVDHDDDAKSEPNNQPSQPSNLKLAS